MIKNLLKILAKLYLKERYYNLDRQSFPSFSQMGEDMIIRKIFENKKNGFYVDVGAYNPKQYSNTYYFYINGWKGLNIDAMPGSMASFSKLLPRDINIESAISNKNERKTYYVFDQLALNTFSLKTALKIEKETAYRIKKRVKINTQTLEEVLDKYLPKNIVIDFMTIDTESMDYLVLLSNNWKKYLPKVIIVEDGNFSFENFSKSKIYQLLLEKGYNLIAKTDVSLIFIH